MYFGQILIYLFYYVTIYDLYHLSVRLTKKLESVSADFNERGCYTLDRSPVHHRAGLLTIMKCVRNFTRWVVEGGKFHPEIKPSSYNYLYRVYTWF